MSSPSVIFIGHTGDFRWYPSKGAGGGGIGDPRRREKKKIERDLALGLVSKKGAERDYGYNA